MELNAATRTSAVPESVRYQAIVDVREDETTTKKINTFCFGCARRMGVFCYCLGIVSIIALLPVYISEDRYIKEDAMKTMVNESLYCGGIALLIIGISMPYLARKYCGEGRQATGLV